MNLIDTTLLSPDALELLQSNRPGNPAPGDIWVLNWNGQDLGLCLIAFANDTYVSAVPVTLDTSVACISAAIVPASESPLRADLVVWAPAPNSVGIHLLGRRIGALCTGAEVRAMINVAAGHDFTSKFPLTSRGLDETLLPTVENIFNTFAALVDHEWVSASPGHGLLDTHALKQLGLSPGKLAKILGEPAALATKLFHADLVPSIAQVDSLVKSCGLRVNDLLVPVQELEAIVLSQPRFKESLQHLARVQQVTEFEARNIALQDSFALAARDSTQNDWSRAENKVRDSLDRLISAQGK